MKVQNIRDMSTKSITNSTWHKKENAKETYSEPQIRSWTIYSDAGFKTTLQSPQINTGYGGVTSGVITESVTSFFTTPIAGQISKKHHQQVLSIDVHGGDMIQASYPIGSTNSNVQSNYLQFMNKKDSLSSRSEFKNRIEGGANGQYMSSSSGFNTAFQCGNNNNKDLGNYGEGIHQNIGMGHHNIISKERNLKQRLGNLTSLSPRSQTAFSVKPSNSQLNTPSTLRVTDQPQPSNILSVFFNHNVLSGSNQGIVHSQITKEQIGGGTQHRNLIFQHKKNSQYDQINFVNKKKTTREHTASRDGSLKR